MAGCRALRVEWGRLNQAAREVGNVSQPSVASALPQSAHTFYTPTSCAPPEQVLCTTTTMPANQGRIRHLLTNVPIFGSAASALPQSAHTYTHTHTYCAHNEPKSCTHPVPVHTHPHLVHTMNPNPAHRSTGSCMSGRIPGPLRTRPPSLWPWLWCPCCCARCSSARCGPGTR